MGDPKLRSSDAGTGLYLLQTSPTLTTGKEHMRQANSPPAHRASGSRTKGTLIDGHRGTWNLKPLNP